MSAKCMIPLVGIHLVVEEIRSVKRCESGGIAVVVKVGGSLQCARRQQNCWTWCIVLQRWPRSLHKHDAIVLQRWPRSLHEHDASCCSDRCKIVARTWCIVLQWWPRSCCRDGLEHKGAVRCLQVCCNLPCEWLRMGWGNQGLCFGVFVIYPITSY